MTYTSLGLSIKGCLVADLMRFRGVQQGVFCTLFERVPQRAELFILRIKSEEPKSDRSSFVVTVGLGLRRGVHLRNPRFGQTDRPVVARPLNPWRPYGKGASEGRKTASPQRVHLGRRGGEGLGMSGRSVCPDERGMTDCYFEPGQVAGTGTFGEQSVKLVEFRS